MTRLPLELVDQHVDAIRAIARRGTDNKSEMTAARLAQRLRQVTDEFLIAENRDRPEQLEMLLAPSIAPNDLPG